MMALRAQKGTPLPPNVFPVSDLHEAYQWCLEFENAVDDITLADLPRRLREARVLGYMLREALNVRGRKNVAKDILACPDDSALSRLADFYINNLFLAFRTSKAFSSSLFHFSSIPPFENKSEIRGWLLEESARGRPLTKAKALYRQDFRCALTGRYDQESVDTIPCIWAEFLSSANHPPCSARVAHILPQYTNVKTPGYSEYAHNIRLGSILKSEDLAALRNVDKLDNVIVLEENKCTLFNELKLWFEEVIGPDGRIIPNQYRMGAANQFTQLMDVQPIVTFTTPDAVNFPLPNPQYLKIHAACARIAFFSGVGKHINDIFTGVERQLVSGSDSSSTKSTSEGSNPVNRWSTSTSSSSGK
ncbi:hypothetical protein CPB84DRAFT_1775216 [Gymnopilus junonius]|uniref:HNH nuclease domain-containing protein n=1 Tax=Gymnopilus junonius TaxID=109634 RepID=A0A9P5NQF4_GYMJU|nr:hypothetical protein CPB84DRAFT_1775216 [Gymnopilus junonius]